MKLLGSCSAVLPLLDMETNHTKQMWAGRTKARRGGTVLEKYLDSHTPVAEQRVHTADEKVRIGACAPTPMCHRTTVPPFF